MNNAREQGKIYWAKLNDVWEPVKHMGFYDDPYRNIYGDETFHEFGNQYICYASNVKNLEWGGEVSHD